jgi:hypothetical protein
MKTHVVQSDPDEPGTLNVRIGADERRHADDGAPLVDPLVHAGRWRTLAVLSLSLFIIGLDNTILNVALPTLQDEFGASPSKLQWIVDSYLLVFAGRLIPVASSGSELAWLGRFRSWWPATASDRSAP